MSLLTQPPTATAADARGVHAAPTGAITAVCAALFALVTIDVLGDARAFFDLRLIRAVQRLDFPGLESLVFRPVDTLTASDGAIAMWALVCVGFLLLRWWLPAMLAITLPAGGLINLAISQLVGRGRPSGAEIERVIGEADGMAYPSGHVVGAVLLYGLLFVVAGGLGNRALRLVTRAGCIAVIAVVGLARVWYGAHWPSDVVAAYALGGLLLAGMIAVYRRIDDVTGPLPLVHAAVPPHDESIPHAHALTSLVLFEGRTVEKIYSPGFLPRVIYWLAFQAEFPYIRNRAALEAARHRRNLAALLTRYWYGSPRVARVLAIERHGDTYAVRGEFVDGRAPADRAAAKAWLRDLRARFEEAGLPTWQIDPRQPRAVDNVLETADGRFMIVDLESGLVAPVASLRSWWRGLRRGLVPLFDDVYYDITRAYVAREEPAMRAGLGDRWTDELMATLDAAERETEVWRRSEPRLFGHFILNVQRGFGVRRWPAHVKEEIAAGRERAQTWVEQAIAAWERDGRVSAEEAAALRAEMASEEFQAVLPHLGAHVGISVVLRFPFGSITRFCWTSGCLLAAAGRLLVRRTDRATWRRARAIHSPLVMVLCLLPTVGSLSYLMSRPLRRNPLLVRVTADAMLAKVPFRLYRRTGLRRLIARRPRGPLLPVPRRDAA